MREKAVFKIIIIKTITIKEGNLGCLGHLLVVLMATFSGLLQIYNQTSKWGEVNQGYFDLCTEFYLQLSHSDSDINHICSTCNFICLK